jgi:alkaline phosphatase D
MLSAFLWLSLLGALSQVRCTPEILERNLAYKSPYISHPALAIDTAQVHHRHLEAAKLVRREIRKRQEQTRIPQDGMDVEYPKPSYGLGVTDWSNAGYIYAGDLNYTHNVASGGSFWLYIPAWRVEC